MKGRVHSGSAARPGRPAAGAPARPAVSLNIERLVLEGLPLARADGARVQAALQGELGRLLGSASLHSELRQGTALAALSLEGLTIEPGIAPERLGERLALALFRGLVPWPRREEQAR